jgi:hypothetical protein
VLQVLNLVDFLMDGQDRWLGTKEEIEDGLELDEGFGSTEGVEPYEILGSEVGEMNGYKEGFGRTGCG